MPNAIRSKHTTFNYRRWDSAASPAIADRPRLALKSGQLVRNREQRETLPVFWEREPQAALGQDGAFDRLVYAEPNADDSHQAVDFKVRVAKRVPSFKRQGSVSEVETNYRKALYTDYEGSVSDAAIRRELGLGPAKRQILAPDLLKAVLEQVTPENPSAIGMLAMLRRDAVIKAQRRMHADGDIGQKEPQACTVCGRCKTHAPHCPKG